MKVLLLFLLLSFQANGESLIIETPRVEFRPASKIQIVCERTCTSNGKKVDSVFFKEKFSQLFQMHAKGDLPKSSPMDYLKKINVDDGKSTFTLYLGYPEKYPGADFPRYEAVLEIISKIELQIMMEKEK